MGLIGKRRGKVVKGVGAPGAAGSANVGGSLSKNDHWYLQQGFGIADTPTVSTGIVASGGVMTEYTSPPGAVYRCHTFVASGSFVVTSRGTDYNDLEYVVIAGGGGGGGDRGGGGGAGGYRSSVTGESTGGGGSLESALPAVVATYPIVIGAGGRGGRYSTTPAPDPNSLGADGENTVLTHPTGTITSTGGGGAGSGGGAGEGGTNGRPGGSGGGGTGASPSSNRTGGTGTANQGYAGGPSPYSNFGGGGGGGAGSVGKSITESPSMQGGAGVDSSITGYPLVRAAGGGGGGPGSGSNGNLLNGGSPSPIYPGGIGGPGGDTAGQNRGYDSNSTGYGGNGVYGTGSGGGGSGNGGPSYQGGHGSSGFVAIRYRMPEATASAKATGGDISFYNGKVIHTFLTSGTFVTPGSFSETCEYVVIGGGGGTGHMNGGGGSGAYRTSTMPIGNGLTIPVSIGYGGNGWPQSMYPFAPSGTRGAQGGNTVFGHPTAPITSPGGGYGNGRSSPVVGNPGGSGGGGSDWAGAGGAGGSGINGFPGTIGATPPTTGWGGDGGAGSSSDAGAGGGGGAGGDGGDGTTSFGGQGGLGIQLPTTFRSADIGVGYPGPTSPTVTGADDSGLYYVAGGGGAGGYSGGSYPSLKGGGGGGRPNPTTDGSNAWAGAGAGGYSPTSPAVASGNNAQVGSGSGGGAGVSPNGISQPRTSPLRVSGGSGGSGLVLIAYPQ